MRHSKRYATEEAAEMAAERKRAIALANAKDTEPADDFGVLPCRGCDGFHVHKALKPQAPVVTGNPVPSPSPRVSSRRDTGFDGRTRALIWRRDGGRCVGCGVEITEGMWWSLQHREPRQVGGNGAANGIVHCGSATSRGCHRKAEDRTILTRIRGYWIKVNRIPVPDPADVPVWYAHDQAWFRLDNDGGRVRCEPPVIADPDDLEYLQGDGRVHAALDGTLQAALAGAA